MSLPYAKGSDTSKAAAIDAEPGAEANRRKVLNRISTACEYGATADELCGYFGAVHNSIAPRVSELKAAGEIVDSGMRRKTRQGSRATVYVTKEWSK